MNDKILHHRLIGLHVVDHPYSYQEQKYGTFVNLFMICICVIICIVLAYTTLNMDPIPDSLPWILCALSLVLLLVTGGILLPLAKKRRLVKQMIKSSMIVNPASRNMDCYGTLSELEELTTLTEFSFEPVIFQQKKCKIHPLLAALFYLVLFLILTYVAHVSTKYTLCIMFIVGLTGVRLIYWIHPVYIRIYPGKLQVIRYDLNNKVSSINEYSLRDARIEARFDQRKIIIIPSSGNGDEKISLVYDLDVVDNPHVFVKTVFQAAISAATPPPPPRDSLVG